jgi:hypothetical protein
MDEEERRRREEEGEEGEIKWAGTGPELRSRREVSARHSPYGTAGSSGFLRHEDYLEQTPPLKQARRLGVPYVHQGYLPHYP